MAHPSQAVEIELDEGNEAELLRHHVRPRDVWDLFENDPAWRRNRSRRAGTHQMIGRDRGGRLLTVVVLWKEATLTIRPITGWDSSDAERNHYLNDKGAGA